jgi:hypothetical protein
MVRILKIPFLLLLAILFSCEKDQQVSCVQNDYYAYLERYPASFVCTDTLCNKYLAIWKQLFREKNYYSNDYFDSHIEIWRVSINNWNSGASFSVCYRVKSDWAVAYNCDQFIIRIDKDDRTWPALTLPRDTYLSISDIRTVTTNHAFSSGIALVSNNLNISPDSFQDALHILTDKAGVNTLCSTRINIDRSTGDLFLEAYAEYVNKYNECVQAKINLKTMETNIVNGVCFIID